MSKAAATILRIKTARPTPDDGAGPDMHEALRRAVAGAARTTPGAEVETGEIEERGGRLGEMLDGLPDVALLALLGGDGGDLGLAVLDVALVGALVAMRLTGCAPRVAPASERPVTAIDAALLRGFVDAVLSACADGPDRVLERWLACRGFAPEVKPLRYSLAPGNWRVISFTLTFAQTGAGGRMTIALPDGAAREASSDPGNSAAGWAARLDGAVRAAPLRLAAVLHRKRVSLEQLRAWEPGDRIDIPGGALDTIAIESGDGTLIFHGRLGQARGQRAVRLSGFGVGKGCLRGADAEHVAGVIEEDRPGRLSAPAQGGGAPGESG